MRRLSYLSRSTVGGDEVVHAILAQDTLQKAIESFRPRGAFISRCVSLGFSNMDFGKGSLPAPLNASTTWSACCWS